MLAEKTPLTNTRLRARRMGKGFALYELARLAGCSLSTIHACEKWGHVPSPAVAARIAAVLGVEVQELWPEAADTAE
jgi:DNA-binding XRE family transcriptional regulator